MQTLQQYWSLQSPATAQIYWTDTKIETMDWAKVSQDYVVACYTVPGAGSVTPLSKEVWQKDERVCVDILVKVTSTVDAAIAVRESMKGEVYRILHTRQFTIPNVAACNAYREDNKVESSDVARVSIEASCLVWDIH